MSETYLAKVGCICESRWNPRWMNQQLWRWRHWSVWCGAKRLWKELRMTFLRCKKVILRLLSCNSMACRRISNTYSSSLATTCCVWLWACARKPTRKWWRSWAGSTTRSPSGKSTLPPFSGITTPDIPPLLRFTTQLRNQFLCSHLYLHSDTLRHRLIPILQSLSL